MSFSADYNDARVVPSPNHDERKHALDMLVLHYTAQSSEDALERLCDGEHASRVSSHYLVHEDGRIDQLVPEERRAWHAGVSSWEGVTDINSRSIGIEIVNPGHEYGYPDFPALQIGAVIALSHDIIVRRRIRADRVVAHSDIAPGRKIDPGEKFPWPRLATAGVGLWIEPAPIVDGSVLERGSEGDAVKVLQIALSRYGYGIASTSHYDEATEIVVTAFQRHFRPARIDGIADASTLATLRHLLTASASLA